MTESTRGRTRRSGTESSREQRARRRQREQQKWYSGFGDVLERAGDVYRTHPIIVTALVIVALVVGMLYWPTRGYYVAVRTGQDQQALYDAYAEQNGLLREDLERLQSQEGIEDEAHRRGLVKEDETSVVVDGVPDEDTSAMLGDIVIEDTRPWYIKVLDVVFLYDPNNWQ